MDLTPESTFRAGVKLVDTSNLPACHHSGSYWKIQFLLIERKRKLHRTERSNKKGYTERKTIRKRRKKKKAGGHRCRRALNYWTVRPCISGPEAGWFFFVHFEPGGGEIHPAAHLNYPNACAGIARLSGGRFIRVFFFSASVYTD